MIPDTSTGNTESQFVLSKRNGRRNILVERDEYQFLVISKILGFVQVMV